MRQRALIVGLTGGVASGKSAALRAFRARGAQTLSLDEVSHKLSRKGGAGYRPIVSAFGPQVLDKKGEVDRGTLGRIAFSDPAQRRKLEKILHPLILKEMRRWIKTAKGVVKVVEVPLLFEAKLEKDFDATMTVEAPLALRRRRAAERGGATAPRGSQLTDRQRRQRADVVLSNAGSPAQLKRAVRQYHEAFRLISAAGGRHG